MISESIFSMVDEISLYLRQRWGVDNADKIGANDNGTANIHIVNTDVGKLVLKEYEFDASLEAICKDISVALHLKSKALPVVSYHKNIEGRHIDIYNGVFFTLMDYIEGSTPDNNELNDTQMQRVAVALSQVNTGLEDYIGLPMWTRTSEYEKKRSKLQETILRVSAGDYHNKEDMLVDLKFKLRVYDEISTKALDFSRFTYRNSHGDFSSRQLIFDTRMNLVGILDFDRASKLPVSWELMRSFLLGSETSSTGEVNVTSLSNYISEYMKKLSLTRFDLENMCLLYLLQLTPTSHGYNPWYYSSQKVIDETNRWGRSRTSIIRTLYKNSLEISNELVKLT